jgi:L-serine dehydratase
MNLSIFDIFKIGIGPSSSHTMGPMNAAKRFLDELIQKTNIQNIAQIKIEIYGSLALTKNGHGTILAIELGLEGYTPETIVPHEIDSIIKAITDTKTINLLQKHKIPFILSKNLKFENDKELPYHPNGMRFKAIDKKNTVIYEQEYYSIGGGFVVSSSDIKDKSKTKQKITVKYFYNSFAELTDICLKNNLNISDIVFENEKTWRTEEEINNQIQKVFEIMQNTVQNGLYRKGEIKGGLHLKRRAPILYEQLKNDKNKDPLNIFDWVMLWALATGEENASYGQVVTAPTNGASAVIPAVFHYYTNYYKNQVTFNAIKKFILTAGAIGILCKINASISGAEGGCQAEIGTACAMAAAGLTAALNGTNLQCENAAIMALTHNLGLICDPVAGLVQIPCIERNALNAIKAISASRLALREKQSFFTTLDQIISTMKEVGEDMPSKYKETAQGGLAIHAKIGRKEDEVVNICDCTNCCKCSNK